MLRLLLLLHCATVSLLADSQCPNGYQVMGDGRCIRALYVEHNGTAGELMSKGIDECKKDGAILPIIRSDQENTMFNNIVAHFIPLLNNPWLILGAVCNPSTRRLEWMDGSKITYIKNNPVYFPPSPDLSFDCVENDKRLGSELNDDYWIAYPSIAHAFWTVLCVVEPKEVTTTTVRPTTTTPKPTTTTTKPIEDECGDFEQIADPKDDSKSCFKIFTTPASWHDAQKKCADEFGSLATINSAQENSFFWGSADAKNLQDGMHIGAYQSSEDGSWRWVDDDKMLSGYDNFAGRFPMAGLGGCSAMLTESSTALWINEDCDYQKLPFVCRREGYSKLQKDCPRDMPEEGKDIFAPGFPIPSVPCEYMLVVDAKSVVQLEILTLEANPDQDYLVISEGSIGNNLLANLTGTNPNPSTYMTKSSNIMRVNWKPNANNRPPQYRGFRIRYRAIATGK